MAVYLTVPLHFVFCITLPEVKDPTGAEILLREASWLPCFENLTQPTGYALRKPWFMMHQGVIYGAGLRSERAIEARSKQIEGRYKSF